MVHTVLFSLQEGERGRLIKFRIGWFEQCWGLRALGSARGLQWPWAWSWGDLGQEDPGLGIRKGGDWTLGLWMCRFAGHCLLSPWEGQAVPRGSWEVAATRRQDEHIC